MKVASPETMVNRSSWFGWMCSEITPPGMLRQVKRTSWPSLSSATVVYSIHSPVAGLKKGRKAVMTAPPGDPHRRQRPVRPAGWGRAA